MSLGSRSTFPRCVGMLYQDRRRARGVCVLGVSGETQAAGAWRRTAGCVVTVSIAWQTCGEQTVAEKRRRLWRELQAKDQSPSEENKQRESGRNTRTPSSDHLATWHMIAWRHICMRHIAFFLHLCSPLHRANACDRQSKFNCWPF